MKKTLRYGASFSLLTESRESNSFEFGPTAPAKRQLRAGDHSPRSSKELVH
jgi:hypothetical protein